MRCDGCGHEQEGGRFCGRCGDVVATRRPPAPTGGTDLGQTVAGDTDPGDTVPGDTVPGDTEASTCGAGAATGVHDGGASPPDHDARSRRPTAVVAAAVAIAALVLGVRAIGGDATPPATDGRVFDEDTGSVLVLTDLEHDLWLYDLDTGVSERLAVPTEGTHDPVHQVLRVGDHVGLFAPGSAWLWRPRSSDLVALGQVHPVPDADPARLWLQDLAGGATLVDELGEVVHEAPAVLQGRFPLRGVPGGLALTGEAELVAYRMDDREVHPFLGGVVGHVPASSLDRVVWCDLSCETFNIVDGSGRPVAELGEDDAEYEPTQTWLADDGRHLASSARVEHDDGVGFELHVFDVDAGSLVDRAELLLGLYAADWTQDGQQLLFRPQADGPPATLQRYVVDEGFSEARLDVDEDLPRGDFVTLPRSAVDWAATG